MRMSELPGISVVDFIPVPTRDLERSVAWYGDVLGLKRSVYMPERNFAEFETDNVTLTIMNSEKMGLEFHPNSTPMALRVDDVAAAKADLEAKGVEFLGDVFDTSVCHMGFFKDPDGNAWMLHHRYKPRVTDLD